MIQAQNIVIEAIYNGSGGTSVKEYKVVAQDNSFPVVLFYGTYEECINWKELNCK